MPSSLSPSSLEGTFNSPRTQLEMFLITLQNWTLTFCTEGVCRYHQDRVSGMTPCEESPGINSASVPLLYWNCWIKMLMTPQRHSRELCFGNLKGKYLASSLRTCSAEATAACPIAHSQEHAPPLLPARAQRTPTRKPKCSLRGNLTFCAALHLFSVRF